MALQIDGEVLAAAGVVDVTLNCDTNLFVDPSLLAQCRDRKFAACADAAFRRHFEQVVQVLTESREQGDFYWRNADRLLHFPEAKYTHLGYSSGGPGSGSGEVIRASLLSNSLQAIRLGVTNPNLFLVLTLFETGIGADRISDMTTGIVLSCLASFSVRTAGSLGVACEEFEIQGQKYHLPRNPISKTRRPIVLVPEDIVRDLPMAADWEGVASVVRQNSELRERVSRQIGEIWKAKTVKDKEYVRSLILGSRETFNEFLGVIEGSALPPYSVHDDPHGEIYPANIRRRIAESVPLDLLEFSRRALSESDAGEVVRKIIAHFQRLVELNGIWTLLYDENKSYPKREKASQRLFFAIASAYCDANNVEMSPEADSGVGPVDFKFTNGTRKRVIVELKKSTNPHLISGYVKQVGAYEAAERATEAHYVVIDVGGLTPLRTARLQEERVKMLTSKGKAPEIWYIDAVPKESASKR